MKSPIVFSLACLCLLGSSIAQASDGKHKHGHKHKHKHDHKDEKREAGAHEHGHGKVNMAIEGKVLSIELEVPGADIVGFEHKAKSKGDKAKVEKSIKDLKKASTVFAMPASAGCKLGKSDVEIHQEEGEDHNEFHATYQFECSNMGKLSSIDFVFFKRFKNSAELETSVVTTKGSKKFEATPKKSKISLKGLI